MSHGTIIVGAGHGGSQLAASLRQEGYDKPITLIGSEPEFPYHRPPLSKTFLKGEDSRIQSLRADVFYKQNAIEFLPSTTVTGIDLERKLCRLGGLQRPFEKLVLAAGAKPRWPCVAGTNLNGVFALRTAEDARRIRARLPQARHIVVAGGGFIGLEAAATFTAMEKSVTIIEIGDRLLARAVCPAISQHVASRLAGAGAKIAFNTGVSKILGNDQVMAVATTSGEELPADFVLVGIGAEPDLELAREAGIACDDGILVDEYLQTSHPDVYALGDCARFPHWQTGSRVRLESVQNATDQARLLAKTIMGIREPYRAVPWFWSDIGDMKLQMVGLSIGADEQLISGDPAANAFSVYHFSAGKLIAIDSVNRPADHMMGRRMIAAGFSPSRSDAAAGRANEAFKQAASPAKGEPAQGRG
ncbi:FAD-dependent oxidoreductase [Chelativorans sp. Marseille-P2723]|uniref:NAD(P)/FAD-dependent oxidoreductase n=1 Tax=Chelativorans sp. Marseille-P2723 TaxID=2709133 RepID=UPI00156E69F7|nr:FAD-dependent oxidoreductase [Chelativorans sp. Marseille-P2723]